MITAQHLFMTPVPQQLNPVAPCTAVEDPVRPGWGLTFFVRILRSETLSTVGRLECYFTFLEGVEYQVRGDERVQLAVREKRVVIL